MQSTAWPGECSKTFAYFSGAASQSLAQPTARAVVAHLRTLTGGGPADPEQESGYRGADQKLTGAPMRRYRELRHSRFTGYVDATDAGTSTGSRRAVLLSVVLRMVNKK